MAFASWLALGATPLDLCISSQPTLLWLQALSDGAIAAACLSIPPTLAWFIVRHRGVMAFKRVVGIIAAFILLCGITHGLEILTLFVPAPRLAGAVKAITALVSILTACVLWFVIPKVAARLSAAQGRLRDSNEQLAEHLRRLAETNATLVREIEERRQAEQKLHYIADHDSLTGLCSSHFLRQHLACVVASAINTGRPAALLALDLDGFKQVNDMLGHPVGDKVLQATAERLRRCLRADDVAARIGGDEFVVVQPGLHSQNDALLLAERIVAALSEKLDIDGHELRIGVSVGISLTPDDGTDPATLLRNADLALYESKREGGNAAGFFHAGMNEAESRRRVIEADLRLAIQRDEFELAYQPIIDVASGRPLGYEALLRWNHPHRGIVLPEHFISIAEQTRLIVPIGAWVLSRACHDAALWPDELTVAVNLSAIQLCDRGFMESVRRALMESGLKPARLELEVTESVLLRNNLANAHRLRNLAQIGIGISLDDFGTGYSSLGYLRDFPFGKVKIDRSLIANLDRSHGAEILLRSVLGLGQGLGIKVTAEGVETEEQFNQLRAWGCAQVQGFLFGHPAPLDQLATVEKRKEAVLF